jgi:anti-anti-sigma regulatory factor
MKHPGSPARGNRTLRLIRLPGSAGPVLRCLGELSVTTVEALRRELNLLLPLGHRALTLNLTGCTALDATGIAALLDCCGKLRAQGRQLILVAGPGPAAELLSALAIPLLLPVYPDEAAAAIAARDGAPEVEAPISWKGARERSLSRWQAIADALDTAAPEEVGRMVCEPHGLCEHSEHQRAEQHPFLSTRCHICPLFTAIGGREEDLGCQSITGSLLHSLTSRDYRTAREQIALVIRLIEELPLPAEPS